VISEIVRGARERHGHERELPNKRGFIVVSLGNTCNLTFLKAVRFVLVVTSQWILPVKGVAKEGRGPGPSQWKCCFRFLC